MTDSQLGVKQLGAYLHISPICPMQYLYILAPLLLGLVISAFCIPQIVLIAHKKRLFDNPEYRKVHHTITPRLGGVSFIISIILATTISILLFLKCECITQFESSFLAALCSLTILSFVGMADDLIGLKYKVKFVAQFIAATLTVGVGLYFNNLHGFLGIYSIPNWVGIIFSVLFIVAAINSINLIDGINGLAAGICGISFAVIGFILWLQSQFIYTIIAFAALGMLLPFLYFNVFAKKCKIFMGDSGSLVLGYLAAFLIIRLGVTVNTSQHFEIAGESLFLGVSTILVPILDVIRVMLYRQRNGYHVFRPDRNHIHHKFLAAGFTSKESLYLVMVIVCIIMLFNAIVMTRLNINIILLVDILLYTAINMILSKKTKTTTI